MKIIHVLSAEVQPHAGDETGNSGRFPANGRGNVGSGRCRRIGTNGSFVSTQDTSGVRIPLR